MKVTMTRRTHLLRRLTLAATALPLALLSACAMQPPQPWEKGNLAKREMTLNADPLDETFMQHVYFSKEAASGGSGVGGGGCGCN